MSTSESNSTPLASLNYATPSPNQSWIWITLAALANIASLFAVAILWLPRTYTHPANRVFGYFNYAKISTDLYNNDGLSGTGTV